MNIETSGLMALFSGGEALENLQSTLLQDGAVAEQFAGLLQEQLGMLQQAVEQHSVTISGNESIQNLQEFAALIGKELPAIESSVTIDLDETLRTLNEVIASLSDEAPRIETDVSELLFHADKATDFLSVEQDSADASDNELLVVTGEAGLVINQPSDTLKPIAELVEEITTELPEPLLTHAVTKKPEKLSVADMMDKTVPVMPKKDNHGEAHKLTLSGAEQADHLFSDVIKKPEQGVTQNTFAPALAGDTGSAAADRSFSAMAADIGMLNRSVSQDSKAELVPMSRHFAHPEWGKEFADKIVWMHRQAVPAAELNLNPRHLGPISIHIDVSQDQTSVSFVAQHAVVKEAIEAALPRLRDMLGEQELNLVDVNVSQQQSEQRQSGAFGHMDEDTQNEGGEPALPESQEHDLVDILTEEIENGRAIASQGILSLFA